MILSSDEIQNATWLTPALLDNGRYISVIVTTSVIITISVIVTTSVIITISVIVTISVIITISVS